MHPIQDTPGPSRPQEPKSLVAFREPIQQRAVHVHRNQPLALQKRQRKSESRVAVQPIAPQAPVGSQIFLQSFQNLLALGLLPQCQLFIVQSMLDKTSEELRAANLRNDRLILLCTVVQEDFTEKMAKQQQDIEKLGQMVEKVYEDQAIQVGEDCGAVNQGNLETAKDLEIAELKRRIADRIEREAKKALAEQQSPLNETVDNSPIQFDSVDWDLASSSLQDEEEEEAIQVSGNWVEEVDQLELKQIKNLEKEIKQSKKEAAKTKEENESLKKQLLALKQNNQSGILEEQTLLPLYDEDNTPIYANWSKDKLLEGMNDLTKQNNDLANAKQILRDEIVAVNEELKISSSTREKILRDKNRRWKEVAAQLRSQMNFEYEELEGIVKSQKRTIKILKNARKRGFEGNDQESGTVKPKKQFRRV